MATDELDIYLNDHLSGASAAISLLDRMISGSESAADRGFFQTLKDEIQADASSLEEVIERVGGRRSAVRQAGGWVSEKLTALKMRVDDPGGTRLSRFEALEMLALGILGKRALWRILRAVATGTPGLEGIDLEALERRAQQQYDRVEARRIEVGRQVFTSAREMVDGN